MIAMTSDTGFVLIWMGFTLLALLWVLAAVLWSVKSKQFRGQDRARYLALWSGIPGEEDAGTIKSDGGTRKVKEDVQP